MKKRPVSITEEHNSFFVRYLDRVRGQRYLAACFYAADTTREEVVKWVKLQNHLHLEEEK